MAGDEVAIGGAPEAARATAAMVTSAAQLVAAGSGPAEGVGTVLPVVLSDVPVAILLIDLSERAVTFANRTAVAMAADQRLPVPLDAWGEAAGLTDLAGEALAATANPLSRLATGTPVSGEAVLAPGVGGGDPMTLWVTGFPLSTAAEGEQLALVVLLEIAAPGGPASGPAMLHVRDRAIIATDLAFTITDPRKPDNPLIWVNPAFTRATGYSAEDACGFNCRFLQGPATDQAVVAELREAIRAGEAATRTLLNYRKDGTAFWNQVAISPVFDGDGRLVSFVGVQTDVTERVRAETERERAYAAERAARRDAESARLRLGLLAEAGAEMAPTQGAADNLERLADLVVPGFADRVVVRLLDERGAIEQQVVRHRSGRTEVPGPEDDAALQRIIDTGRPVLLDGVMHVPLVTRDVVLGAMTFVAEEPGRAFGPDDLRVAAELGRRAGLIIDNGRLYARDHHAAIILQRSLLPALPEIDGLAIGGSYLPGDDAAEVGGDWYEVLALPDGSVGVAVGDVVGHDISAAADMGHLRGLLRACAWTSSEDGTGDPATVLDRVDRLIQGLHVAPMASLVFGRLGRPTIPGGPWTLQWASAGHPPLLVRLPDGTVRTLDDGAGVMLGVGAGEPRASASMALPTGAVLVGYTDGLIERRGEDLDAGLRRLADGLAAADPSDIEALVHAVVGAAHPDGSDDTAVLAVRIAG